MGKKISSEKATNLCTNFDKKYAALSKSIGEDDNRSVLFSLQGIKEYISYLESSNESIDGLRVYLGSNKETNLTTVFFAPTSNGKDNTTLDAYNYGNAGMPPNNTYPT